MRTSESAARSHDNGYPRSRRLYRRTCCRRQGVVGSGQEKQGRGTRTATRAAQGRQRWPNTAAGQHELPRHRPFVGGQPRGGTPGALPPARSASREVWSRVFCRRARGLDPACFTLTAFWRFLHDGRAFPRGAIWQ
eukprot:6795137-Lingulodinium_polyedra.AAC.1